MIVTRMMRRTAATALAALVVASLCAAVPAGTGVMGRALASDAELQKTLEEKGVFTCGDYCYTLVGTSGNKARIVACTSTEANVAVPAKLDGYQVVSLAGGSNVENDAYPDGKTRVGVFDGCETLQSIVLPEGFTTIGTTAFKGCTNLKSVKLPSTLKKINTGAFSGCSGLTELVLPQKVSSFGYRVFEGSGISKLVIPGSVKSTGNFAFTDMPKLQSIEFKTGLESMTGRETFAGCSKLESVKLPSTAKRIHPLVFMDCKATKVTVSGKNKTFKMQSGMLVDKKAKEIVHYFGTSKTVKIPKGIKTVGGWSFYNCKSINTLAVKKDCTTIGRYAFYKCTKLKSATLAGKLKKIKEGAFHSTVLKKLTLGSKVKYIQQDAFYLKAKSTGKSPLRSVKLPKGLKQLEAGAFGHVLKSGKGGVDKTFTIKAKKGSIGIKYAKGWKLKYKYV